MQLLESEHDEIVVGPSDRNFGFTMASVFALIGAFGWYKGSSYAPLWLGIAAIFAGLTLWRPQSLGLANRAWLRLGLLMYRVVNPPNRPGHAHVRQGFPQARARPVVAVLLAAALRSTTAV